MSPLVTRPSLPEPGTVAASMPLSAESFRTDGASGASAATAFGAAAGAAGGRAGGAGGRGGRGGGRGGGGGGLGGRARGRPGAAGRTFIDLPEQRADGDRLAVLGR